MGEGALAAVLANGHDPLGDATGYQLAGADGDGALRPAVWIGGIGRRMLNLIARKHRTGWRGGALEGAKGPPADLAQAQGPAGPAQMAVRGVNVVVFVAGRAAEGLEGGHPGHRVGSAYLLQDRLVKDAELRFDLYWTSSHRAVLQGARAAPQGRRRGA